MATKEVELTKIEIDGGTQARVKLNPETLADYQAVYEDNHSAMPPLVVFYDGSQYWLADGFHRFHSARTAGLGTLPCDIKNGTQGDAQWYASGANKNHGQRRTNADKRRAVEIALSTPQGRKESDNGIGRHCGVSPTTVGTVRGRLSNLDSDETPDVRVGRDGREINVSNIGRRPSPKTAPEPDPEQESITDAPATVIREPKEKEDQPTSKVEPSDENNGMRPPAEQRKRAFAIERAEDAIEALKRVPKDDGGHRERAAEIVTEWIKQNIKKA